MEVDINGRIVNINDESLALFKKLTPLQQRAALGVLAGKSQRQAYIDAGGKASAARDINNVDACASELLRNPKVRTFLESVEYLKLAGGIMSREEMELRLTLLARSTVSDVVTFVTGDDEMMNTETGEIVNGQSYWALKSAAEMQNAGINAISELTAGKDGLKVKLHSSVAAMKQLAELKGYNKPVKLEHSGSLSLADLYVGMGNTPSDAPDEN